MQLMRLVQTNESRIKEVDLSKVKKFEPEPEEDDWDSDSNDSKDKWD